MKGTVPRVSILRLVEWNFKFKQCPLSKLDIFSPWNKAFARRHLIYLSFTSLPRFCSVRIEPALDGQHIYLSSHSISLPRGSRLRQVPESIIYKGLKIWLYDRNRGLAVAAGPLGASAPSGLRGFCVCNHRNQIHAGEGMRALSSLPIARSSRYLYLTHAVIFIPSTETRNIVEGHTVTPGRMACALRLLTIPHVTVTQSATDRPNFFLLSCLPSGPTVVKEDSALLK
jgi:hypothetical protein